MRQEFRRLGNALYAVTVEGPELPVPTGACCCELCLDRRVNLTEEHFRAFLESDD